MNPKFTLFIIASATSAMAAFGPNNVTTSAFSGRAGNRNPACLAGNCPVGTATTPIVLGEKARDALLFQIEEERMARELYTEFGKKHGLWVFDNIAKSEARHEAVFAQLAVRAGITPPVSSPGVFASKEVQARYDALLKLGIATPEAALRVGAFVEEQDIADLRELAAAGDSAELKLAVSNQEKASGNHLGAFVRNLAARGITYEAQVLSASELSTLVSKAPGAGNGGGRSGRGWRGGR